MGSIDLHGKTHIAPPANHLGRYEISSDRLRYINTFQHLCININNETYLFVDGESLNTLGVLQYF